MATQRYHVLLEWDPETGMWVTYVPTLNGLSTFGETREEALSNTQEAILGYLEAARKEGISLEPAPGAIRGPSHCRDAPVGRLRGGDTLP
jgi:predicted RNase H-like HicB family nuclease